MEHKELLAAQIKRVKQMHHDGTDEKDWHNLLAGGYLRDLVYGANDGIITTFAVVAGVAGAELSATIVLVMGAANLLADGFSMSSGNYLSEKSNREYVTSELKKEEWEIEHLPEEEKKEIREIYQAKGLSGQVLEEVVKTITADKKLWAKEMLINELGLLPNEEKVKPLATASVTFVAFVVAGTVPLLPYIFKFPVYTSFVWAIVFTGLALFVVGSLRALLTEKKWWLSGLEMLIIGAMAASVAYIVGAFLAGLV
ncbi:MAG: VIT1/CCC1 transporter family protein [Patescibacteria group bacterium]